MENTKFEEAPDLIRLTGDIVAAYVSNNSVPASGIPILIHSVHRAVSELISGHVPGVVVRDIDLEKPTPAEIRKSVQQSGIVSFIDGKTYKTLKRHLTANGLSPQSYRERYGLPTDYPCVDGPCGASGK